MHVGGSWVEEEGRGEPVLFLSGLGYSGWCWRDLAARLARRRRTIVVDNRGTGRSHAPAGDWSIEDMADDAARVLHAGGHAPASIVAHSMGGYIAQSLALRHPAAVQALVLVATSAGGPDSEPVPAATLAAWRDAAGGSPQEYARTTMPLSFAPGWTEANAERFEALLVARLEHPTLPASWAKQFAACVRWVATGSDAEAIRAPVLVVHGTADRVVPFVNGERLTGRIRSARLVREEAAGHLVFLERSHAVGREIERFLGETPVEARR